jgi:hypothetical protein
MTWFPTVTSRCADCGIGTITAGTAMIRIATIALLLLLAVPANAQDRSAPGAGSIFHDAHGRVTGSARTDANGVTTFHDRAGRVTGTARTDSNGVTTFHDASGRVTGSIRR